MPKPTRIQHPLLNRPGMSQRKRGINMEALRPEFAKLDDRSMANMLLYIYGYARNVIFHDHKIDPEQGAYTDLSNWLGFFENSLPFQLARFSDVDPDEVEAEFEAIAARVDAGKTVHDLVLLFEYGFNELFVPVERVWRLVDAAGFDLLFELNDVIRARMAPALERYITLRNTAAKYLCVEKLPFDSFTKPPWNIPLDHVFGIDDRVTRLPGGEAEAIAWFRDELSRLSQDLFRGLRRLVDVVPGYIEKSLDALEERNEPHLGLLFAFIRLYTHFQDDLNRLSVQHLDFFYQNVLKIKPRGLEPDHVHLFFEIANHLQDGYLIEKGTVFRDGKDDNGIDIDFTLDEEIIIDKAKVAGLKTVNLNTVRRFVGAGLIDILEGIYIAPVANSADGVGADFAENQTKNWATLGAKTSKFLPPGPDVTEFQDHPYGRVGFVLSSPILWLNEGERTVTIDIDGQIESGDDRELFVDCFYNTYSYGNDIRERLEGLFSGSAEDYLEIQIAGVEGGVICSGTGPEELEECLNKPFFAINAFSEAEQRVLELWLQVRETPKRQFFLDDPTALPHKRLENAFRSPQRFEIEDDLINYIKANIFPSEPEVSPPDYYLPIGSEQRERAKKDVIDIIKKFIDVDTVPGEIDDCPAPPQTVYIIIGTNADAREKANIFISESAQFFLEQYILVKNAGVFCESDTPLPCLNASFADNNRFSETEKALLRESVVIDGSVLMYDGLPLIAVTDFLDGELVPGKDQIFVDDAIWNGIRTNISTNTGLEVEQTETFGIVLQQLNNEAFEVEFSGLEGWFPPVSPLSVVILPVGENGVRISFTIRLDDAEQAVVFYNAEAIGETYALEAPYPAVKIELNPELRLFRENASSKGSGGNTEPECCLARANLTGKFQMAVYQLFRSLKIDDIRMDVGVCGVRNLLVQNEENLQDVNDLVLPFGVRPKVGAECFIGSKEILCKTWNDLFLTLEWKDRPANFEEHYADYLDEDGQPYIEEETFKIQTAILRDGGWYLWNEGTLKDLFISKEFSAEEGFDCAPPPASDNNFNGYGYTREEFIDSTLPAFETKSFNDSLLQPLTVNSREAFLRLKLEGDDFQHDAYPFVLARNLIQLAGLIDPVDLDDLVAKHKAALSAACKMIAPLAEIERLVSDQSDATGDGTETDIITDLENVVTALEQLSKVTPDAGDLQTIKNAIDLIAHQTNSSGSLFTLKGDVDGILVQGTINNLATSVIELGNILSALNTLPGIINSATEEVDHIEAPPGFTFNQDGILQLTQELLDRLTDAVNTARGSGSTTVPLTVLSNSAATDDDAIDFLNKIIEKIGGTSVSGTLLFFIDQIDRVITAVLPSTSSAVDLGDIISDLNTIRLNLQGSRNDVTTRILPNIDLIIGAVRQVWRDVEAARSDVGDIKSTINSSIIPKVRGFLGDILAQIELIKPQFEIVNTNLVAMDEFLPEPDQVENLGIPNEPYTPLLKSISIDYNASSDRNDIELIHLHPFDNSSLPVSLEFNSATPLEEKPTLFPSHTDEGTLYIGLKDVRPGSNVQLLFQFAESTADSESGRAEIEWAYLRENSWEDLRTGFEVLEDETKALTTSGIVKILLPRDFSNEGNTLMPPVELEGEETHLYWLRVSAKRSVAGVAEVVAIHSQAAKATFSDTSESDLNRVNKPLDAGSVSKPLEPDFNIKKVDQPYPSFGGSVPEREESLYTRVSEHLRHKGRSIDAFDVEHLVLEAFPTIFKCKCISHTLGLSANTFRRDLEVAPGFMVVAVIPDLTKLKAGDGLEPKAPVSLLEEIKGYLKKRMSPFARLRVMNPRYEKIKVKTTVRIKPGRDETFYEEQLKVDLKHFLAPWHLGDSDKLSFGQQVTHSEVIGFIEKLDYIDFIDDLKLFDAENSGEAGVASDVIVPATARSILTGGEICVRLNEVDCDSNGTEEEDDTPPENMINKPVPFKTIRKKLEDA